MLPLWYPQTICNRNLPTLAKTLWYSGSRVTVVHTVCYPVQSIGSRTPHLIYSKYEQLFTSVMTREKTMPNGLLKVSSPQRITQCPIGLPNLDGINYKQNILSILFLAAYFNHKWKKKSVFQPYHIISHWNCLIHQSYRLQIWRYQREFVGPLAGPLAYCVLWICQ